METPAVAEPQLTEPQAADKKAETPEPQPASDANPAAAPDQEGEPVSFKVQYGKAVEDVTRGLDTTVGSLKEAVQKLTRIEPSGQKLLLKGVPLKDDAATLRQVRLLPYVLYHHT